MFSLFVRCYTVVLGVSSRFFVPNAARKAIYTLHHGIPT